MKTTPKSNAKNLRKNSTDAERKMWSLLRNRQLVGYKFRRQHPIKNFIVDFACIEKQLIIEVDGGQHLERKKEDDERTQFLEIQGYRVLRFWNDQIFKETESVLEMILKALEEEE
ncbi:MAG: endonuclease domain-containing protein [Nitrospinae bacterium]|jgi:very-short-patch-repair endonuclease|nr:endonuclease domain-containing protein [Nitrospinota bacterium]MDA1108747.1 endonuclease domain-containing protein [Nitrospinota bacterium]